MTNRVLMLFIASAPLALLAGQAPTPTAKAELAIPQTDKSWNLPKTPWGVPDLQGTWTSDDTWGVPMERPKQYGNRLYLTEDELKEREKQVQQNEQRVLNPNESQHSPALAQLEASAKGEAAPAPAAGRFGRGVDAAPAPGNWLEFAKHASRQTSQVIDPPDGRIPPLTPEAQKRLQEKNALRRDPRPASWENWSLYDRCITRGVLGSIIPVIYGNGLEIVQSPGYVAIRYEMVHDVRIIPVGSGLQHLSSNIRSYMGDPIGHWEGNTLVVETTNFLPGTAIGANGDGGPPISEDMKITERFTRVGPNTINYEATIDDPKTYTGVWKIGFPITHEPGYQLFEYACHEGNMAMHNMLSAARAEDRKAQEASQQK